VPTSSLIVFTYTGMIAKKRGQAPYVNHVMNSFRLRAASDTQSRAAYTLYSVGNVVILATPESIAACDTARATSGNNLGSIGFGSTY
jgi:hypothetical protein